MVEEVRNHLKEMLESSAIRPSQSAWCNTMVLVQKKDSSLHFCIDFCHLNACMKKDSYPLPRIQEALESLVGTGHDDLIVFSWMAEEHLHRLRVVVDQLREYNLKLKP